MTDAEMMEKLRSMVEDKPAVSPTAESKPKAKVAKPEPTVAEQQTAALAPSGVKVPVVVLDDGETFSNLRGARVCLVDPEDEEIEADAYRQGIDIGDLLTLRDAVQTILRIVG